MTRQAKKIGSVQRAINILNLFDKLTPELGTTEIARALGLPKSTVAGKREKAHSYVCEELSHRFPNLKTIAITLRGSLSASHNTWSAALWHDQQVYFGPAYDIIPIVDRVGC